MSSAPSLEGSIQVGAELNPFPKPNAYRSEVKAGTTVALKPDRTRTSENLDADALNRFFNETLQKPLEQCVRAAKARHPGPAGEIELTITLNGAGRVTGVTVNKETLQDKALVRCLTRAVFGVRLPVPRDGKSGTVTFVIDLAAK